MPDVENTWDSKPECEHGYTEEQGCPWCAKQEAKRAEVLKKVEAAADEMAEKIRATPRPIIEFPDGEFTKHRVFENPKPLDSHPWVNDFGLRYPWGTVNVIYDGLAWWPRDRYEQDQEKYPHRGLNRPEHLDAIDIMEAEEADADLKKRAQELVDELYEAGRRGGHQTGLERRAVRLLREIFNIRPTNMPKE